MRKLMLFVALFLVTFMLNTAYAVTEMGWSPTTDTNVSAAVTASDAEYLAQKAKEDAQSCTSNNYGLGPAYMYKATGTTSYCDDAFAPPGGGSNCGSTTTGSSQPDRNKTRDCFLHNAIAYSICGDVVSGANKTTWETRLDDMVERVSGNAPYTNHGTRTGDTDESIGHYFGCMVYDIAKDGTLDQCPANFGGIDVTGVNTSTIRNAISLWFGSLSDGSWVEGSTYNFNTLAYLLEGVNALNDYYGVDKFPEITSLYDNFTDLHVQYQVPDFSEYFQYGDIEGNYVRNNAGFRALAPYAMMAHLDNDDANMWYVWDQVKAASTTCPMPPWLAWYDHDTTRTAPTGQTSYNAEDGGLALWHEDWGVNDTFFANYIKPVSNVDHDTGAFENMAVWRDDDWVIDYPRAYYGSYWSENIWYNSMLVNSGFGTMREASGQVAFEAGSDYMYHSATTGGFVQANGSFYDPPPAWITEHGAQRLFRENPDGTQTIFDYHRIDSCNPDSTLCMSANKKARLAIGQAAGKDNTPTAYARAEVNNWDHVYQIFTDTSATQSGDKFSWTANNGVALELYTFMDSYTDSQIDVAASGSGTPYWFSATAIQSTERNMHMLRLEVDSGTSRNFVPALNTIHIGTAADTYVEVTDGGGDEAVAGAMVENGTDRVVFLANADPDTTTIFTSTLDGSSVTYDPDRFTKTAAMQEFKLGGVATFTTDDTKDIEVFIVGLDTSLTWTIEANSSPSGCTVSANGICTFTISGAAQLHNVTWSVSGAVTCNDSCAVCSTEGACNGSTSVCYWHNNDGATVEQCNDDQSGSQQCVGSPGACATQDACETNEYCWDGGVCQLTCDTTGVDITLYATEDTYLNEDAATTNYNGTGLQIRSSTGSGGGESIDPSTFSVGGTDSADVSTNSTRATATGSLTGADDAYISKDYGTDNFGEMDVDFTINTQFQGSAGLIGFLCFSNTSGANMTGMDSVDDGICLQYGRFFTPDGVRIRDFNNTTSASTIIALSGSGTTYYGSFDIDGTTATLEMYTDSGRTTHTTGSPQTLTVDDGDTTKYRHLYLISSGGGLSSGNSAFYIESITMNESDGPSGGSATDLVTVLEFDLSSIPANSNITNVDLEFVHSAIGDSNTGTLEVYTGLRDFSETQATWNEYTNFNAWTTGGARGGSDMTGTWSTGSGTLGTYSVTGVEAIDAVNKFSENASFITHVENNIGSSIYLYVNQIPSVSGSLVQIYDSENATETNRPRLDITYTEDETIDPPVLNPKRTINGGRISIGRWGG